MSVPATFFVGFAHWRTSLDAIVDPLMAQSDERTVRRWALALFYAPYPIQTVPASWGDWLYQAQAGRCFWCQHPVSRPMATVEHVIPQSSGRWPLMARVAQLLSLRMSHAACNQAYAVWRRHQDATRVQAMDQALAEKVDHTVQRYPLLQLARYHQYETPVSHQQSGA